MGPREFALPLVLAACLAAAACERADPEPGSRALRELEGLAFLTSTEFVLWAPSERSLSPEARVFRVAEPLLIDRFEVTRADWLRFQREAAGQVDPLLAEHVDGWAPGTERWPATYMNRAEAEAFAAWRGMRLATADEWLFAALGPSRWSYPWGTTFRDSVANTIELGLGRPAPVGTFESGRTPGECYDLLGNVSEWVAGPAPTNDRYRDGDGRGSALGGSFRSYRRKIYDVNAATFPLALDLHPESRSDHVGLRCAAEAEDFLWRHAPDWGDSERDRARLVAVGERFGRQALPLLAELAARPGAPAGLAALAEGARR